MNSLPVQLLIRFFRSRSVWCCGGHAELVDLDPTVSKLCGLPVPEQLQGKNLARMFNDPKYSVRKAAFCASGNSLLLRNVKWAYLRHGCNAENAKQLYDTQKDPRQYLNLAETKEATTVLKELDDELTRRIREVEDSDIHRGSQSK